MTSSRVDKRIAEYQEQLHEDDLKLFNKCYSDVLNDLRIEEIKDELVDEYQHSEDHLQLIVATASGFHHNPLADGFDSGYRFAFTEPLEEQNLLGKEGVKNGDVLLARETDDKVYLCIVECKAGACGDRNWVTELQGIQKVVETDGYKNTLKSQLGVVDKELRFIQYVLLGKITQTVAMDYGGIDDEMDVPDEYAFWGHAIGSQSMVHVYGKVCDHQLQRTVGNTIDTGKVQNPIQFTFSDHSVTQLKVVIGDLINEKKAE
jgi:hypothetical protein